MNNYINNYKKLKNSNNIGFIGKNISYPIVNIFIPLIYNLGFTPNVITTITLLLRCIVIYNIYNKINHNTSLILFIISWLTDCIDGQLARNYNMKTKFGGIYDSVVDFITCTVMILVIFLKYYKKKRTTIYVILFITVGIYITQYFKTKCTSKNNLKIWEDKIINRDKIKLKEGDCEKIKYIFLYDEDVNYVIMILFLIYTFYYHKE